VAADANEVEEQLKMENMTKIIATSIEINPSAEMAGRIAFTSV